MPSKVCEGVVLWRCARRGRSERRGQPRRRSRARAPRLPRTRSRAPSSMDRPPAPPLPGPRTGSGAHLLRCMPAAVGWWLPPPHPLLSSTANPHSPRLTSHGFPLASPPLHAPIRRHLPGERDAIQLRCRSEAGVPCLQLACSPPVSARPGRAAAGRHRAPARRLGAAAAT